MEKTRREQLQLWNNLSFDPQKTDVDEHIDLVATLGNMLKQDGTCENGKIHGNNCRGRGHGRGSY